MSAVDALQLALAGEHAAVYAYGVAGAWLSGAQRGEALRARDAHRARRDGLRSLVTARRREPVAAEPAYALPRPVQSAKAALSLATLVEERLAAVYADMVGQTSGDLRALAARGLQDAAVRAARWRGTSEPFPGLPER